MKATQRTFHLIFSALLLLTAACSAPGPGVAGQEKQLASSPAGADSAQPNLFSRGGDEVLLSWLERLEDGTHRLRYSRLRGRNWSAPGTIAAGSEWFVNWADFPSVVARSERELAAHWLAKSGEGTFAYDILLSFSTDAGRSWSKPVRPHQDGTQTEHGFVSISPWGEGYALIWLDGRNTEPDAPGRGGPMTLRGAFFAGHGTRLVEQLLDESVCDCCQTALVATSEGLVGAYRDRSGEEIRDISYITFQNGLWSEPKPVARDGWEIAGCPVNGPALAESDGRVAVAWFTSPNQESRVQVAFMEGFEKGFGTPLRVDEGSPIGRVDVGLDQNRDAWVSWIELKPRPRLLVRRVTPQGALSEAIEVSPSTEQRAGGFPQLAVVPEGLLFAWTEAGEPPEVRTKLLGYESLQERERR